MKRKLVYLLFFICVGIILYFYFANPIGETTSKLNKKYSWPNVEQVEVKVDKSYENGVHTLTGVINLPTPCYSLDHEITISSSYPGQVRVDFYSESSNNPCAQLIDDREFMVTFQASESASINAYINNVPVLFIQ